MILAEYRVAAIFAGNWVSAWMEATRLVDDMYCVKIDEKTDIVIASAGGYPKDISLYQSQKTLDNARYAVKKGGVVVILAECPDIAEPSEYFKGFTYPDVYEQEKALRENYDLPGWVALRHSECCRDNQVILLTRPGNEDYARTAKLHPVFSMEEALKLAYEKSGLDRPRITVMPFGANTFPLLSKT